MSIRKSVVCLFSLLCCNPLYLSAKQDITEQKPISYVLYAQNQQAETIALLRTIEHSLDAKCPTPLIDNLNNKKIVMLARENPAPIDFPITVCEAIYPKNTQLYLNGSPLLKPTYQSENIAVFGDSGCKSSKQDCALDSSNWFFNKLANIAANTTPDVTLHVGDYNYSGTSGSIKITGKKNKVQVYDAGDNTTQGMCKIAGAYYGQNSQGSQFRDRWIYWLQDFFKPAQSLLQRTPWVFARGNHELCSRAGIGWFYLLDSNSSLLGKYASQLTCPAANNPSPLIFSPPYALNLDKTNILVLDSTNACDSGQLNLEQYQNQFTLAKQMLQTLPKALNILQTHRPIFAIDKLAKVGSCGDSENTLYCSLSQTLQQANQLTRLTDTIQLLLAGHMHRFQSVNFKDSAFPPQLVVGNSGVILEDNFPAKPTQLDIQQKSAFVNGISEYGYLHLQIPPTRNSSNTQWKASLIGIESTALLACQPNTEQLCK